jgi:excinuclease ABC subunit A
MNEQKFISVRGASEHNLKNIDVDIARNAITVITGVSGSGKSSLAFDTILAEAQRRFFYTLSHYSRQFLDLSSRPNLRTISGLSPAVSLQQNETQPSSRATVATLTDVGELLGVLFANFAKRICPEHDLETASLTQAEIIKAVLKSYEGKTIVICAPLVDEKKGNFAAQLQGLVEKGYTKAFIDGEVRPLVPLPKLKKELRHTLKLIVDTIKVKASAPERLIRGLETSLTEGEGYCEVIPYISADKLDIGSKVVFSTRGGCPECGFSWPKLDARYFSSNSLGRCQRCDGMGSVQDGDAENEELFFRCCDACQGTGLDKKYCSIRLGGKTVTEFYQTSITALREGLSDITNQLYSENPAFTRVQVEISDALSRVENIGLGYLNLSRRIRSLSGGEAQRLRLASILADSLRGVMYILDEPSQGLHPSELESVWRTLQRLKDHGNTVIIVDHDEFFMHRADHIIDLGPGGGEQGGRVIAAFVPAAAGLFVKQSATAQHLVSGGKRIISEPAVKGGKFFKIKNPRINNLRMKSVSMQLQALNVITGVSGAGKSSLVLSTIYPNLRQSLAAGGKSGGWEYCDEISGLESLKIVEMINRKPIAKSAISMPITYLDLFTDIRKLYEQLPDSQLAGLTARSYSLFAAGGRCEECDGRGRLTLSMRFLADARVPCPLCNGRRYQDVICDIKYLGKSIDEVLDMTLVEAHTHFKNHRRIVQRLDPALEIGLGYLKLGQPSASLSGGEAQRLKLVPFLGKGRGEGSVLIIDEPTCGLHFEDVFKLLKIFKKMTSEGATLLVIEHHPDVISSADWVVDIGPGASISGGRVLYQGHPGGLIDKEGSPTGMYLKRLLADRAGKQPSREGSILATESNYGKD